MEQQSDIYSDILRRYWGYEAFRGIQRDIIDSVAAGRDTLGLMPTGGGKSITFQVPAMAMPGVCLVITPLIALMKDQVANLRRRGIIAAAIHSGMSHREIVVTLENCILGSTKVLYVSPERLTTELFLNKLRRINVSMVTVDEAHCISQWGYDFRPSYMRIADIRRLHPHVPVLALTASATPRVVADIMDKLSFREENVIRMSFERPNLAYVVREISDKRSQMVHILRRVDGSAIVYVRSRQRSSEISAMLNENGIDATFFHAGLSNVEKDKRQAAWTSDKVRVMVATTAFGMGIDKPDVRLVVHADCPGSLEEYFQEAGRAGRDGRPSYAVLLYDRNDDRLLRRHIRDTFPPRDFIREVYDRLAFFFQIGVESGKDHTFVFDIDRFCTTYRHYPGHVVAALRLLTLAGYIECDGEPDAASRLMFVLGRDELYRLDDLNTMQDRVITALLRRYTGLFTEYRYISETTLAEDTHLTAETIYTILKGLTQRNVLHYIPMRKLPTLTYVRDRVDSDRLVIGRDVYEERRRQLSDRAESVIAYANNNDVCRSRQLLRYFDETKSHDCGRCDVCLSHRRRRDTSTDREQARQQMLNLLADGQRHHITELNSLPLNQRMKEATLRYLIDEEQVRKDGSYIYVEQPHSPEQK